MNNILGQLFSKWRSNIIITKNVSPVDFNVDPKNWPRFSSAWDELLMEELILLSKLGNTTLLNNL